MSTASFTKKNNLETLHISRVSKNELESGSMCSEIATKLERDALNKKLKKNAHEDPFVKQFEPKTILYLLDSVCVNGNGHSSLIFLDNKGRGIYYNTEAFIDIVGVLKADDVGFVMDRKVVSTEDVTYLLYHGKFPMKDKSKEKKSLFKYDKFIAIPIESYLEGKIALNKAEQIYQKPGFYNLFERNCNHITQEVLAEIGKNFSEVEGSSKLVKERFGLFVEKLSKLDIPGAKKVLSNTYDEIYEMGILPNGSYEKGVEFAKQRKYKFGGLPIKDLKDLTYKPAQYFDPITDNLAAIKKTIDKHYENSRIRYEVEKIYKRDEPYYGILMGLYRALDDKNIKVAYNLVNKHHDLKVDRNSLKRLVGLYNLETVNLTYIQRSVFQSFIKKNRIRLQENKPIVKSTAESIHLPLQTQLQEPTFVSTISCRMPN